MEAPVADGNPVAGLSAIITGSEYAWGDDEWMVNRRGPGTLDQPVSFYEVHLGSWRRRADGYTDATLSAAFGRSFDQPHRA